MEITFKWNKADRLSQLEKNDIERDIRNEITRVLDPSISKLAVSMFGDPLMISLEGVAYGPSGSALVKITYSLIGNHTTQYQPLPPQ